MSVWRASCNNCRGARSMQDCGCNVCVCVYAASTQPIGRSSTVDLWFLNLWLWLMICLAQAAMLLTAVFFLVLADFHLPVCWCAGETWVSCALHPVFVSMTTAVQSSKHTPDHPSAKVAACSSSIRQSLAYIHI